MRGAHLLIVDDEENLRSMLAAALRHHGFEVSAVANGRDALCAVAELSPDLVLLDVMLPDLDGFEVCRRLRASGDRTPVLFLTAREATEDKVRGLTLGGDDYVQKPFSLEELVARATAVLRRTGRPSDDRTVLTCGDLTMDDDAHRVVRGGVEVALSPTEYNLLRYLLVNQGRVVSKAQILDHVWQYDFGGDGGVVETYVGYLRRKLDTGGTAADQDHPRESATRCAPPPRRADSPMGGLSLRARVLAGMAAVAIVLVVAALIVTATTVSHLVDQVDDRLAAAARPERDDLGPRPPPPRGPDERLEGSRRLRGGDRRRRRAGHDLRAEPQWRGARHSRRRPRTSRRGRRNRRAVHPGAVDDPDLRYRVLARAGSDGVVHVTALPLDRRRRHDQPPRHGRGHRHAHRPRCARCRHVVGDPSRNPPDQTDDPNGDRDRRRRHIAPRA